MVVLPAEELVTKAKGDGKGVHMAHGLFIAPENHEIGRTLLDALPSLLESGDIKVSGLTRSRSCHVAFAYAYNLLSADAESRSRSRTARRSCLGA